MAASNVFAEILERIRAANETLIGAGQLPPGIDQSRIAVEPPRDAAHGDMATNAAMVLAKDAGRKPRELAELICHARALARFFAGTRRAVFRCDWWGLAGRTLFDPEGRWAQTGAALGDHRAAALDVPIASLVQAWPEAVARLMAPVLRALEPDLVLNADWVRAQAPRWRRS